MSLKRLACKCAIALFVVLLFSGCQTYIEGPLDTKIDNLKRIRSVPQLPEVAGDKLYWEVVKGGKRAIPLLIGKIDDETPTKAEVPVVGGKYLVGDVAVALLQEIVHRIPIIECAGGSPENGFADYWRFVRETSGNRAILAARVRGWYVKNHARLRWIKDTGIYGTSPDWPYEDKTHPAEGYYVAAGSACE